MSNFADVSKDVKTIVGEPLEYPSSPNPVVSSATLPKPQERHAKDGPPLRPSLYFMEGVVLALPRVGPAPLPGRPAFLHILPAAA